MTTATTTTGLRPVNPSTWSAALRFDQGQVRSAPSEILTVAGQGPIDADGHLLHEGDPAAQLALAFANVLRVVEQAGMAVGDLAHVRIYVTDMSAALAAYDAITEPLAAAGANPPSTLVEVSRLAIPGMTVEIDAVAIR